MLRSVNNEAGRGHPPIKEGVPAARMSEYAESRSRAA